MKIEIDDTDHARLVALSEETGEPDLSRIVSDALDSYCRDRSPREPSPKTPKTSRWAEAARFHRERPSLTGKSEQLNDVVRQFRDEFAV